MWKNWNMNKDTNILFLQGMWCWRRHATSGIITFTFNNYCTWPVTKFPIVQLTDIEIKDDIGIKNGILRKRFIRELKELKKTADYTSCDGGLTANFLSRWTTTNKNNMTMKESFMIFLQGWTRVSWVHLLADPRRTEPRLDAAFECSWPWGYAQGNKFINLFDLTVISKKKYEIQDKVNYAVSEM